jgi:hypothetical protein
VFDLHVLRTPPALILSQDQTLQLTRRVPNPLIQVFRCFWVLSKE